MTLSEWFWSLLSWSLWVPAFTTSTIVGGIGFVVGTAYKARVEKGIQARFDRDIEKLRSELRTEEEKAKAAFRERDAEIDALRRGALSGLAARQVALEKRRMEAAERVWQAVVSYGPYRTVSTMAKRLHMDRLFELCERDQGAREMANSILQVGGFHDPKAVPKVEVPDSERPFVSPLLWAQFSAYRTICSYPTIQLIAAKGGVSRQTLKSDDVLALAKVAVPEYSNAIDEFRERCLPMLLEPLEEKILAVT